MADEELRKKDTEREDQTPPNTKDISGKLEYCACIVSLSRCNHRRKVRVHLGKTNFYTLHVIYYTRTVPERCREEFIFGGWKNRAHLYVCVWMTGSSSGVCTDEQLVRALDQPSVKSRWQNVSFGTLCLDYTGCRLSI